jgi:hypothetical protein
MSAETSYKQNDVAKVGSSFVPSIPPGVCQGRRLGSI